jgi:hypothetical protein
VKIVNAETTVTPEYGQSGSTAKITIAPNIDGIEKKLIVYFTASNTSNYSIANVAITQVNTIPVITATSSTDIIDHKGGEVIINLKSNLSWASSISSNSVTLSKTAGGKDTLDIIATIPPNLTLNENKYQITFECTNGTDIAKAPIVITQTKAPDPIATFNPTSKSIPTIGGSFDLRIDSNYKWKATVNEGVTLSQGTGDPGEITTITVAANNSGNPKTHNLIFTIGEGEIEKLFTYTINQE